MLKAHQACIDLEKGVLRIQGREVKFLSEHELPDKARDPLPLPEELQQQSSAQPGPGQSSGSAPRSQFPGSGAALGGRPASAPAAQPSATAGRTAAPPASRYSEESIRLLMDLGATREVAIQSLEAAGGNVDVAASLLF